MESCLHRVMDGHKHSYDHDLNLMPAAIAKAIREAIDEEREACAAVADTQSECGDPDIFHAAQSIAEIIRAREK